MALEYSYDLLSATAFCGIAAAFILFVLIPYLQTQFGNRGPWGLPILGYYPFLKQDFYAQLSDLSKKHGDAYMINLVGQSFLYLNSVKAVREVFVQHTDSFFARSEKHSLLHFCFRKSVSFLKGDQWRHQRKFLSQSMRDVGLGPHKEELKGPIGDSIRNTIQALRESQEEPVDVSALISKECASALLTLILGDDVSDEDVDKINEAYLKMVFPMGNINTILAGNIAKHLVLQKVRGYDDMIKGKEDMTEVICRVLKKHRETFNPDEPPKDLIDHYLTERHQREKKKDPSIKYFEDEVLVENLHLAYGDGSVTFAAFTASFLQDLSQHPDAQAEIHREIVDVIGTERQPCWEDRSQLPLAVSAIKELFRVTLFFPVFPSLECAKETSVMGLKVNKGCITLVNNWAMHRDPSIYKDPHRFNISRFLAGDSKEDDPVTFGIGKRACAGEVLVMTEMFLFLTSLLQNFQFLPSKKEVGSTDSSPYEEAMQCRLRAVPWPATT